MVQACTNSWVKSWSSFYKVVQLPKGSAVTQTTLGGLTIISSGCKFLTVYMCQKLWKLAHGRQSYSKNYQAYFFWPTLYIQATIGGKRQLESKLFSATKIVME